MSDQKFISFLIIRPSVEPFSLWRYLASLALRLPYWLKVKSSSTEKYWKVHLSRISITMFRRFHSTFISDPDSISVTSTKWMNDKKEFSYPVQINSSNLINFIANNKRTTSIRLFRYLRQLYNFVKLKFHCSWHIHKLVLNYHKSRCGQIGSFQPHSLMVSNPKQRYWEWII